LPLGEAMKMKEPKGVGSIGCSMSVRL